MLSHEELVDLYRNLRDEKVLSVYLDGKATDFAERKAWKRRLDQQVNEARRLLDGEGAAGREAFDQALERIEKALGEYDSFLPDNGWVGFATPSRLVYGKPVRVPMPDLVRWEGGIRVAPYVRALKQDRVVVTVLVDSRRARIFEYRNGELVEPKNLNAETFLGDLTDINVSKRATSHTGVRGKTGTDAAQRFLEVGSERMLKALMEVVTDLVGKDGLLVIGGTTESVASAMAHVPPRLKERTLERPHLRLGMSEAEVREELEKSASELNQRMQAALLEEVINLAKAGGRGELGPDKVEKALGEARVDTLLVSRNFIRANPDYADHLVGSAFEQHTDVEELSGEGAERLDLEGEGVGARLRYTLGETRGEGEA
jgi:hypothetical protein